MDVINRTVNPLRRFTMAAASAAFAIVLFAPAAAFASSSQAMKALDLKTLCTSEVAAERTICRGYLQGFLDGASQTDSSLTEAPAEQAGTVSSWAQRAFETRVGTHVEHFERVERVDTVATALSQDFCVTDADAVQAIKDRMRTTAQRPAADSAAGTWLLEFVQTNFPCQPTTS